MKLYYPDPSLNSMTLSPQKIIMGGGVLQNNQLFPIVGQKIQSLPIKYIQVPEIIDKIDTCIVPPALGGKAGVLGAIVLAQGASEQ